MQPGVYNFSVSQQIDWLIMIAISPTQQRNTKYSKGWKVEWRVESEWENDNRWEKCPCPLRASC